MATNVPVAEWRPTDGNSEYDNTGVNFIVDPLDTFLVDPSGVFIIDTGVTATLIPATIWEEEDSR